MIFIRIDTDDVILLQSKCEHVDTTLIHSTVPLQIQKISYLFHK